MVDSDVTGLRASSEGVDQTSRHTTHATTTLPRDHLRYRGVHSYMDVWRFRLTALRSHKEMRCDDSEMCLNLWIGIKDRGSCGGVLSR